MGSESTIFCEFYDISRPGIKFDYQFREGGCRGEFLILPIGDDRDGLQYKARSFRSNKTYDNYEQIILMKGKHPEDWWD